MSNTATNHTFKYGTCSSCGFDIDSDKAKESCKSLAGPYHDFKYGMCSSCGVGKGSNKAKEPCKDFGHSFDSEGYCIRCNCKKSDNCKNEPCPGVKTFTRPAKPYYKKSNAFEGYMEGGKRKTRN